MPQLANVVLIDNAAASHTFKGVSVVQGIGTLADRHTSGMPQLSNDLVISNTKIPSGYRFKLKLRVPVVVTDSATSKDSAVDEIVANVDIRLPYVSTKVGRANMRVLLSNAFKDGILSTMIDDIEGIY